MIPRLFVFAYPEESAPYTQYFSPKHLFQIKNIQCSYSEKYQSYILVAGSGSIHISVALSVFFEKFSHLKNEIVCFNIGIAGSYKKPLHQIFYASKIVNYHNEKTFYPDIFVKHPMAELVSIEFPADKKIMSAYPDAMFDMEGFAFANTLKFFAHNHQIHCIKFISDNDGIIRDIDETMAAYHSKTDEILALTDNITKIIYDFFHTSSEYAENKSYVTEIENIANHLPLTQSQKYQFKKAALFFLKNHHLSDLHKVLSDYSLHAVMSKRERNRAFQSILKTLYNV